MGGWLQAVPGQTEATYNVICNMLRMSQLSAPDEAAAGNRSVVAVQLQLQLLLAFTLEHHTL